MKQFYIYIVGFIFLAIGIYMSVALHDPHFYAPFSIGLTLISVQFYKKVFGESLFHNWKNRQYVYFWILLVIACLITDQIGIYLNLWHYPHYAGISDEVIKLTLEYAVPFVYFLAIFLSARKLFGFTVAVLVIIPLTLVFTEYINSFSDSWVVTMPMAIWYTVGAWLMTLMPWYVHRTVD